MNFETTPERIARLDEQTAFRNLVKPKERKDADAARHGGLEVPTPSKRYFHVYKPPRPLDEIDEDIARTENGSVTPMKGLSA